MTSSETLEWPRFCYTGSSIFEEKSNSISLNTMEEKIGLPLIKKKISSTTNSAPRKRKSTNNKLSASSSLTNKNSPKVRRIEHKSLVQKEDQTVPSMTTLTSGVGAVADLFNLRQGTPRGPNMLLSSLSTTPPPPQVPEFAFSNMMRKMASKYQQNDIKESEDDQPTTDNPYGQLKHAPQLFSTGKYLASSMSNPALDTAALAAAAAALGQCLPFPLNSGNLSQIPRLNQSTPAYPQVYPFAPFLHNLSSVSPSEKTNILSELLASTSAAAAALNKEASISQSYRGSNSDGNSSFKNDRLRAASESSDPIDLSASTTIGAGSTGSGSNLDTSRSDINEDDDEENVDVLSIDPPASPSDVEQWSVNRVVDFVSNVESCQDYQEIFREHCIDGSALVVLSETHMTRILGMKLGPAFRLRSAITDLMNRTTSPSFCITN